MPGWNSKQKSQNYWLILVGLSLKDQPVMGPSRGPPRLPGKRFAHDYNLPPAPAMRGCAIFGVGGRKPRALDFVLYVLPIP